MARQQVAATPRNVDGYNLTDSADYQVLTPGADNGVELSGAAVVYLKNGTAGAAVFTIVAVQSPQYSTQNLVVPNKVVNVAANKEYVFWPSTATQSAGKIAVDCDIAGEVLGLQ